MTEYVLGHTQAELDRLVRQGRMYETATRELFQRARLRPGMRVLDVGCGTGDVSMLVAEIVGPGGLVVGVDRSEEALDAARRRADDQGVSQVEFRNASLDELTVDERFDALVGRFILMHQADPGRFLKGLLPHVRPGGAVAFLESKMSASVAGIHSQPFSATFDRMCQLKVAVIRAVGAHNDMAFKLGPTFVAAGLAYPSLRLHAYQDGGEQIPRYAADSLKSMLPMITSHGIASLTEADIDEMETALLGELAATGGVLTAPLVVGAASVFTG